jgi:hypothetical protein
MGNAPSKYAGLPRTSPGDDQQRSAAMFDSSLLRRVEIVNEIAPGKESCLHHHGILGKPCDTEENVAC